MFCLVNVDKYHERLTGAGFDATRVKNTLLSLAINHNKIVAISLRSIRCLFTFNCQPLLAGYHMV